MNKKKKIINKALSLLLCFLMTIPVISLYAYADNGNCSEWSLKAAIAYDYDSTSGDTFPEDQTDITIPDYNQGHTVTVRVWYEKNVGTTTYDPDTNPAKITVPFMLDGAACSTYSKKPLSNVISVKNPNTEIFSATVGSDGSVVLSCKTTIDKDTTLTGYFDVLYSIGNGSYSVYLINNKTCTESVHFNSAIYSNTVSLTTDIPNIVFKEQKLGIKAYACVLERYKDYYFVSVTMYSAATSYNKTTKTGGGIPYNFKNTTFTIDCDDEDAEIIVCDTCFNLITPDENERYVVEWPSSANSTKVLIGYPKNLYSDIVVTGDVYGSNSNCTYDACATYSVSDGCYSHESENLEKLYRSTAVFDPQMYISVISDASFEEVYYSATKGEFEATEDACYGKDESLVDSVTLSEADVKIKVAQYAYVPLEMTDKTLKIAVNGISLTDNDGNSELLSSDKAYISKFSVNRPIDASNSSASVSDNKKLTFSFYIRKKGQNAYSFYKTISNVSYISVSFPSETESFYVDITGFTNGVGYVGGVVSSYCQFYTEIAISKADVDPGSVYRVLGSMDVFDAEGNSYIVSSDPENVSSVLNEEKPVGAVYDSLPFLVNQKEYTPEIYARVDGQYSNDEQTPVCTVFTYLYNTAEVPYKADTTFTVELPDAAYKVIPSTTSTRKTTASDIYIVNEKKYVDLTCANANYSVLADIYMDPDTYFEYSKTYTFTITNTDFEKSKKYAYTTDTLTDTVSVTVDYGSSAHESLDAYAAKSTLFSKNVTQVNDDGTYCYKLRASSVGDITKAVMYCNLETAYGSNDYWQGTLTGIDCSQIEKKGYSARVHYSTNADAGTLSADSSWQDYSSDTDVSKIKSVAVEILTSDGTIATIPSGTLLYVLLNMKAPETISVAHAYNNFYTEWASSSSPDTIITKEPSNTTEVYINSPCSISVNVVDKDGNPVTDEFSFEIYKGTEKISSFASDGTTYTEETLTEGEYTIVCASKPYWYEDVSDQSITVGGTEDLDGMVTFMVNTYSASLPDAGSYTLLFLLTTVFSLMAVYAFFKTGRKEETA